MWHRSLSISSQAGVASAATHCNALCPLERRHAAAPRQGRQRATTQRHPAPNQTRNAHRHHTSFAVLRNPVRCPYRVRARAISASTTWVMPYATIVHPDPACQMPLSLMPANARGALLVGIPQAVLRRLANRPFRCAAFARPTSSRLAKPAFARLARLASTRPRAAPHARRQCQHRCRHLRQQHQYRHLRPATATYAKQDSA